MSDLSEACKGEHETLIERWQDCMETWHRAIQIPETIPSLQINARYDGAANSMSHVIAEFKNACTPRPPQSEWFGNPDTEPGKWDFWWSSERGLICVRGVRQSARMGVVAPFIGVDYGDGLVPIDAIGDLVPIAREGYPAPVGWGVIEGEKR